MKKYRVLDTTLRVTVENLLLNVTLILHANRASFHCKVKQLYLVCTGCELCECELLRPCPDLECDLDCEHGLMTDANGCNVCEYNAQRSTHRDSTIQKASGLRASSGRSSICQMGVPILGRRQSVIWPNWATNCIKIKKIGIRGGMRVKILTM